MRLSGMCRALGAATKTVGGHRSATVMTAACMLLNWTGSIWAQGSFPANPGTRPATRVSYTPDQTKGIINDLSNGYMDDFSRRVPTGPVGSGAGNPTAELRKLQPLIREFADEVSQLGYELNDEVRRIPTIRPLLTDALRISALAVALDRTMQNLRDHNVVMRDVQELDTSWRELAYRLNSVRGLARGTQDRIASLNLINDDIDKAIGIKPRFNQQQLSEKTYSLAQDLRNLIEDVQAELGSRDAQPFMLSLNRARQQVLNMASMLDQNNVDADMIVNEYKRFQALWYPERVKLQQFDNRYFERSLRRVTQTDGEIHQLLLLPTKVDSQQLLFMANALKKDIDLFFDRTSLRLLMLMPRADRVAGVASEFYGVCEHFVSEVNSNAKYDQLVDSFRYIEDAQRNFSAVFYDVPSQEALTALNQIEQTIQSLSTALQVQRDTFDHSAAVELVSRVESEISQLEQTTQRWLANDRQPFSNACLQAIRQMRQQSVQLNQDLVRNVNSQQLQQHTEQLYDTWRTVYNYLVKCQTAERASLGRISSRITPSLVELRTLLTF